ncbi:acetylornithine transaminase [Schaalia vaccimaxillae]|uniref:acetylornithine transaminase n=1 Tax=Schaalia vaccimaxillae TaxID=183916 RepID=UPI0003B665A3|nr:acetylornithine transaminase [Schaalia vaccimaxillae]
MPTHPERADAVGASHAQQRYADSVMNTFGTPQMVLTKGNGAIVTDEAGKDYLDLLGGIAVNVLGHCHPAVTQAIADQAAMLGHVSNFFATEPQIALAEKILDILGFSGGATGAKVFLANSGTEANECALKIVKAYAGVTGRTRILALEHSFHGRSLGALSLTWKERYRSPFAPLIPGIEFIPANDPQSLRNAMGPDVAGLFVEPIQGEAGVQVLSDDYLRFARTCTSVHGVLLVVDEVQTGIARTGNWMGFQSSGITPDVVTLAKGLGGGMPIGACIGASQTANLLGPGMHGTTFGGNPICARAALSVLETIEKDNLLAHTHQVGQWWRDELRAAAPHIVDVRGRGLLIGIDFDADIATSVVDKGREAGFILNATGPATLRLAPPLVVSEKQARSFTEALPTLIEQSLTEINTRGHRD